MSAFTKHLSINENCPFYSPLNWSAKVMIGLMCISIAVFALVVTGRTSTRAETPRETPDPWTRFMAPSSGKILVDSNLPPDYSPIAVVRINGDLFEKVELRNAPRAMTPVRVEVPQKSSTPMGDCCGASLPWSAPIRYGRSLSIFGCRQPQAHHLRQRPQSRQ